MTKAAYIALSAILISLPVVAKTYQCVDAKNVPRRGDTLPAECVNRDYVVLDKGQIVKSVHVSTPEEQRVRDAEAARSSLQESAARDQKLHDKSLTDTYSNANEIELSRSRSLQQVDARINSVNSQLKAANSNLLALQKDADSRNKVGGKPPESLQVDIKVAQERVTRLQQDMEKYKAEKLAVEARYDADKARYKELTGK